jgi:hypothetical protein
MISTPRRMFLRTASASLVVPLVGGDLALAQAQKVQKAGSDPLLAELLRQSKAAAAKAARGTATGESTRQAANALRLLAAHGKTTGADAFVGKALRDAIARDGRAGVLTKRTDAAALAAKLEIDLDPQRFIASADDYATRAAALDAVLKNGACQTWLTVAASLDELAAKLDAQRGVQLVRQSASDCASGQAGLRMLEFTMIAACGPWAGPFWAETCGIATAMYLTYMLSLMVMGCY